MRRSNDFVWDKLSKRAMSKIGHEIEKYANVKYRFDSIEFVYSARFTLKALRIVYWIMCVRSKIDNEQKIPVRFVDESSIAEIKEWTPPQHTIEEYSYIYIAWYRAAITKSLKSKTWVNTQTNTFNFRRLIAVWCVCICVYCCTTII